MFLFFSVLLLCSFFRLKGILFLFFLKMPKIWFARTTLNGKKKEDGLIKHGSHDTGVNFCRSKLNLSSISV